jgi:glyoxylase-like metal-dependent hydrolase (beta-lactamase superfamily II)
MASNIDGLACGRNLRSEVASSIPNNNDPEEAVPATTWKVGDITITKIVELETVGRTRFILPQATPEEIQKISWLHPYFVDDNGRLKMSIHALVVETPTRRIVVDTGLGNDKENRGIPTWNRLDGPFLDDLAAAGYPPDTIDTVLCTHLHVDHVGWNTRLVDGRWVPTFPGARYVIGRLEFDYWKNEREDPGRAAVFDDSVKPVADAGLVDLVASDHQLCDEVTLIPSPGHSPGHHSVYVKSRGEEALLIGDVLHHPCQMAHLDWASTADSDPAQSTRTRHELFARFAGRPTLVLGGHFCGGRIARDGAAYRLEMS